jgi:penicillin-binding protein 2
MSLFSFLFPFKRRSSRRVVLKDAVQETRLFSTRVILGWVGMLLALSFIVVRLVYLQVVDHERYTTLSESNRLKILPIPPLAALFLTAMGCCWPKIVLRTVWS